MERARKEGGEREREREREEGEFILAAMMVAVSA